MYEDGHARGIGGHPQEGEDVGLFQIPGLGRDVDGDQRGSLELLPVRAGEAQVDHGLDAQSLELAKTVAIRLGAPVEIARDLMEVAQALADPWLGPGGIPALDPPAIPAEGARRVLVGKRAVRERAAEHGARKKGGQGADAQGRPDVRQPRT